MHLWNDASVLVVFGRFYAGGSVRDDVADMAAGMWLAAELPSTDRTRIGLWGGSWGGFEALFAAQQASPIHASISSTSPPAAPRPVASSSAAGMSSSDSSTGSGGEVKVTG